MREGVHGWTGLDRADRFLLNLQHSVPEMRDGTSTVRWKLKPSTRQDVGVKRTSLSILCCFAFPEVNGEETRAG